MILKLLLWTGWICFALDAAFIGALIVMSGGGGDAAGRGLGRGWGIILLPFLLIAGGLLLWGTRSNAKFGLVAGTFLAAIPFLVLSYNKIGELSESARYRAERALHGKFADRALLDIVQRMNAGDTTGLRTLLAADKAAGTPLNYTQRDAAGHTLLGFAVERATDYERTPDKSAALQILLQSGVPYAADALEEGGDWNRDLVVSGSDVHNDIIEMALKAGANPNALAQREKNSMLFETGITVEKAKLLVKHGGDVHVLSDVGYNTLQYALRFNKFPLATYYLQQGIDPKYAAPDGETAQTLLDKAVKERAAYQQPMDAGYDEFVAALAARLKSH